MDPLVEEEALNGTSKDQYPTRTIMDVMSTLMPEVDTAESPVAKEEEKWSSLTPRNNPNKGDDTDGEEQFGASPKKQTEDQTKEQTAQAVSLSQGVFRDISWGCRQRGSASYGFTSQNSSSKSSFWNPFQTP